MFPDYCFFLEFVTGTVMDLEASSGEKTLTIAAGSKVTFLDFSTLSTIKSHSMPMSFKEEGGASLHPAGKRFIAGGSDLRVYVFDYETGEGLECLKGHHGPVRAGPSNTSLAVYHRLLNHVMIYAYYRCDASATLRAGSSTPQDQRMARSASGRRNNGKWLRCRLVMLSRVAALPNRRAAAEEQG
jgi:WD40 repeat protein